MSVRFEDDIWHDPATLQWQRREICRQPLSHIIGSAFANYVEPTDLVVEIGSGTGALDDLVDHPGTFLHVEGSLRSIATHKAKLSNQGKDPETVLHDNLYDLQFADESVDVVTGLLVIDAMQDPAQSVAEIARVLKPGGRFLYFHDTSASSNAVAADARERGLIAVPLTTGADVQLALFEPEAFRKFEKIIKNRLGRLAARSVINELKEPSKKRFDSWTQRMEIVEVLTELVKTDTKIEKECTDSMSIAFINLLARLAEQNGMQVVENRVHYNQAVVNDDVLAGTGFQSGMNYFLVSYRGFGVGTTSEVPKGTIAAVAEPLVFAATKQAKTS